MDRGIEPSIGVVRGPARLEVFEELKTLLCGYLRLFCLAISSRGSPREGRTEPRAPQSSFVTAFCGMVKSQRSNRRKGSMSDGRLGEQFRCTVHMRRKEKEFW